MTVFFLQILKLFYIFINDEGTIVVNGQNTPEQEHQLEDGERRRERHLIKAEFSQEDERQDQPVSQS